MSSVFRKTVRVLHLWLALLSGLVVFVVAVTGCIYCFESELRGVLHRDLYEVPVKEAPKQSLSFMINNVTAEFPKQKIRNVNFPEEKGKSVVFALKNKTNVYVDPYTGNVIGSLDIEKEFLGMVQQLHRNLLLGDPGKTIIGISALIFFVMLVSGIVLWWPRNRNALRWKFRIKKQTPYGRRMYDLHSVLGFYASWVLLISVLTGLVFSFKWAEKSMYWLTGSVKNEKKAASIFQPGPGLAPDVITSVILARYPSSSFNLFFPDDSVGVYRAGVEVDKEGFAVKRDFYFFDRYTGKLLDVRLYRYASTGEKVRSANYNLHTGKAFGLPGQLLMFCASLVAASLPVTGLLIWRNRLKKKARSHKSLLAVRHLEESEV